jgi:cell wall-associated NlpC family hydrolase
LHGALVLQGETDNVTAKESILLKLDSAGIRCIDSITVLPSVPFSQKPFAIVNLSAANLRKSPNHSSELVTQVLMGMPLKMLKQEGGWILVKCPDRYTGWVDDEAIVPITADSFETYRNAGKIIFVDLAGTAWREIGPRKEALTDLVAGNILILNEKSGGNCRVTLPDGRTGWVSDESVMDYQDFIHTAVPDGHRLIVTAKSMMGIPYVWGGTSVKGMDCSGFTKTVYFLNGLTLPRDADQQAAAGIMVDERREFGKLLPGDLLFFGRRNKDDSSITHVGIWIGDMRYIHASGRVRINSMDSAQSDFDRFNYNRYIQSNRLQGNVAQSDFLDPDLTLK